MKKTVTALLLTLAVITLFAGCDNQEEKKDGKYAQLAQCLTEKGVKMYGAFWCPHCNDQKKIFGDDWQYIVYIECDERGENANRQACVDAGVGSYPTWVLPGQDPIVGAATPEELAKKVNCGDTIPKENSQN